MFDSLSLCSVLVEPRSGKRPRELSNSDLANILQMVLKNPGLYLREYRSLLLRDYQLALSNAALCRALHVRWLLQSRDCCSFFACRILVSIQRNCLHSLKPQMLSRALSFWPACQRWTPRGWCFSTRRALTTDHSTGKPQLLHARECHDVLALGRTVGGSAVSGCNGPRSTSTAFAIRWQVPVRGCSLRH